MFPNDAIYCFRDISRYKTLSPAHDPHSPWRHYDLPQIAKQEAQRKRKQQAAQAAEAQKRREGGDLSKDLFAAPTRAVSVILDHPIIMMITLSFTSFSMLVVNVFLYAGGQFLKSGIPTHSMGVSLDGIINYPIKSTTQSNDSDTAISWDTWHWAEESHQSNYRLFSKQI